MRCRVRRVPPPMGWATSTTWTTWLCHRSLPLRYYREPKLRGVRTDSVHDVGEGQVTIVLFHDTGFGMVEVLCDQKQRRALLWLPGSYQQCLVSVHILPG
jgi:hypothetical protein